MIQKTVNFLTASIGTCDVQSNLLDANEVLARRQGLREGEIYGLDVCDCLASAAIRVRRGWNIVLVPGKVMVEPPSVTALIWKT